MDSHQGNVKFLSILVCLFIASCGSDKQVSSSSNHSSSSDSNSGMASSPPQIRVIAPDYLISGIPSTLKVELTDDGEIVQGNWYGFSQGLTNQVVYETTVQNWFCGGTQCLEYKYSYSAKDDDGLVSTVQGSIPIFALPINVGQAITHKANNLVTLKALVNKNFEDRVSGEFDQFLWHQSGGVAVNLQNADSLEASFIVPETDGIEKLQFTFTATASSTGETYSDEKTLYSVPEQLWVDVTSIHNSGGLIAALRSDGSVLVVVDNPYSNSPDIVLKTLPVAAEHIKLLDGGPDFVYALTQNGEVIPIHVNGNQSFTTSIQERLSQLHNVDFISTTKTQSEFAGRIATSYKTNSGDVITLSSNNPFYSNSEITKIDSSPYDFALLENGDLIQIDTQNQSVVAQNIKDFSGYFLLDRDGAVSCLGGAGLPQIFSQHSDFVEIESGNDSGYRDCEVSLFAVRQNGEVISYTPDQLPVPPELVNPQSIKAIRNLHIAIVDNGSALLWGRSFYSQDYESITQDIITGDQVNYFNVKDPL